MARIMGQNLDHFIDWFARLNLEYEELEIHGPHEHRLVATVERSLKYLKAMPYDCASF